MNKEIKSLYISGLIMKHLRHELTEAEALELENWASADEKSRQLLHELENNQLIQDDLRHFDGIDIDREWTEFKAKRNAENKVISIKSAGRKWWRIAAASVLLLLSVSAYFLIREMYGDNHTNGNQHMLSGNAAPDVQPGREGAILTLADGSQIVLDSMDNGIISTGNGAALELQNGKLSYKTPEAASGGGIAVEPQWHTLTTPKGRQFSLQLPDGSKVWLNAASSIRFPSVFNHNERKVEITGEAYFEIVPQFAGAGSKLARNEQKSPATTSRNLQRKSKIPFLVKTKHQTIEVLGTHFNVNAYDDEDAERTTLVEGLVRLNYQNNPGNQTSFLLEPGQQVAISPFIEGGREEAELVDIQQITAWKNGIFHFKEASIQTIMRQLARWYNVEVKFQGNVTGKFNGKISRDVNISQVFKILEFSDVRFKIEGDLITVMP